MIPTASSDPKTALGRGYGQQQMSDDWLNIVADKLADASPEFGNIVRNTVRAENFEKMMSVVNGQGEMFIYRGVGNNWTLVK